MYYELSVIMSIILHHSEMYRQTEDVQLLKYNVTIC